MTMDSSPTPSAHAGQAVYNRLTLAFYDSWVHGLSNHWIWQCPTAKITALYDEYATDNHLDIGVGTGYFLARCHFRTSTPRIGLMDVNRHSLQATARRIQRYRPTCFKREVLQPLGDPPEPVFDSVGLTYLLHCLPGSMDDKSCVFRHLRPWLAPTGCVFGATLMGRNVPRSIAARTLMAIYNQRGIFSNRHDDPASLETALRRHFLQVELQQSGCVVLFHARHPIH